MTELLGDLMVLDFLRPVSGGHLGRRPWPGRYGFGVAACALSGVMLAALPASAQTSGSREKEPVVAAKRESRVETLFKEGAKHYQENRFAEAEVAFRKAWELQRTFDIAVNLGFTELLLRKEVEAAGYLSFAVSNWPMTKEDQRVVASEKLNNLRKKLGLLRIRANVANTEILVDGAPLRDSPVAPEIFVQPGVHKVRVSRAGYEPVEEAVSIGKGEARDVELELPPIKKEEPAPPLVAKREGPKTWVLLLGGGVAAASVGAGVGLTVASRAKYAEADRIGEQFNDTTRTYCDKPGNEKTDPCVEIKSTNRAGDQLQNLGTIGFVAGGAALAGTVLYYLISPSEQERRTGVRVQPVITASQGGLYVSSEF